MHDVLRAGRRISLSLAMDELALPARVRILTPMSVEPTDDDLAEFEAHGAAPLPIAIEQGYVDHNGARIWYQAHGSGSPVVLLHGGLGHSGNWGYQVPSLVSSGHRAVLIDSRGHGHSTRDARPYTYELMASDVLAVMDALQVEKAAFVGWSDGACTALILATNDPVAHTDFGCDNLRANTKRDPVVSRPQIRLRLREQRPERGS